MIEGPRVLLRPVDERDTDDILRLRSELGMIDHLFSERPPSREEHLEWLAQARRAGDHEFVIVDRANGRVVGTIGLSRIDRRHRRAEYGVLVEAAARGTGVAFEASRLVLDHAFRALGLNRVYLHVFPDNERAVRLYRRLGFEREGILRRHAFKGDRFRDVLVMGILRPLRVVAAIQARMGSTRLPGKVLRPIGGRPVIERIAERLEHCRELDGIVVSTSVETRDDRIVSLAGRLGLQCVRGSEADLVARLVTAVTETGADALVRITADCPLVDPGLVDRLVRVWRDAGGALEYVSNVCPPTYPDGLDVEVISRDAIERLDGEACEPAFRDAPTSYIWAHPGAFRIANVEHERDLRPLRWTVDYPEDLAFVEAVYHELDRPGQAFGMDDVLALVARRPDLRDLNRHLETPVPPRATVPSLGTATTGRDVERR